MQDTSGKVGIRDLLEAGVHFGHQAKRWNPKMKKYIFAERAGVHIIDLDQTLNLLDNALNFIRSIAEANRDVLFVGTKKQAQITLAEEAIRSGQPYVAERYIGGMLTNFQTIQPRIEYFKGLSARIEETPEEDKSGKDWFALSKEYQKLRRNFAGLTEMARLPGAVFIVDPKREELLVKEANRLKIPVVALTDSNCDPEVVDYVIPGNDDAIRAIGLISRLIADAVLSGRGEDIVPAEERPVPPVVEEAKAAEEEAEERAAQPETVSANGAASEPAVASGASGNGAAAEIPSVGTIGDIAPTPAPADVEAEAQVEAQEEAEADAEAEAEASTEASTEAPVEDTPAEDGPEASTETTDEDAPAEDVSEALAEAPDEASAEESTEAPVEDVPAEDVSEASKEASAEDAPAEDVPEALTEAPVEDGSEAPTEAAAEDAPDEDAPEASTEASEDVPVEDASAAAEEAVEEEAEAKTGEVVDPDEASGHPEEAAEEKSEEEEK